MNWAWYFQRLRSMSAPELSHRFVEQGKRQMSRRRSYGWAAFSGAGAPRPIPGLRESLRAGMSPEIERVLRDDAATSLDGRFAALGATWPPRDPAELFPPELWTLDPVSGRNWPGADTFCFDIDYRNVHADADGPSPSPLTGEGSARGDVKYVWELSRLQFLQPLAVCAELFDDAPAARVIEACVRSWAAANPPFQGLAWASGIELGLRAFSLVFVVSICGERLDPAIRAMIGDILAAHLYWLGRFPSRFSSANNHCIAEAFGAFAIALSLPQLPGASRIAATARRALEREIALQILPDGVPAEQSPTYGAFTLEMLLCVDTLARAFGAPLGPIVAERAHAFDRFIGAISGRSGAPAIGDEDEGRVLSARRERSYPGAIARAAAGHFGFPSRVAQGDDSSALRQALFPAPAPAPAETGLLTFPHGGYTTVRERRAGRDLRLTIDHGPLGYLAIAAHGHADALAIVLTLDDVDLLIDPGAYLYHSGGAWRDWFRGTASHNTVRLNGNDQSVIAGPFNWSHKARAWLEAMRGPPDWSLSAGHDGYRRRFGVDHLRTITAIPMGIAVNDRPIGASAKNVALEIVFQFAPGLRIEPDGERHDVFHEGQPIASFSFSEPGQVEIASGGAWPGQGGWVAPTFGAKTPAPRMVWRGFAPEAGVTTTIAWGG